MNSLAGVIMPTLQVDLATHVDQFGLDCHAATQSFHSDAELICRTTSMGCSVDGGDPAPGS